MGRIFINYRREDALNWAQHILYPALRDRFGRGAVFLDVDANIPRGRDYRPALRQAVAACDVMVSVVGLNWRRILAERTPDHDADPDLKPDSVRVEIAHALERDIPVIPLLVDGAGMPDALDLPEDLRAFAFRQSEAAWFQSQAADLARLMEELEAQLAAAAPGAPAAPAQGASAPSVDPAAAAWARISDSLDARDYTHFIEVFPTAPEAFDAKLQRTALEDWPAVAQDDIEAMRRFAQRPLFPALKAEVARALEPLEEAAAQVEAARRREVMLAASPARTSFRDAMRSGGEGPEMCVIPAGDFLMGSPEDELQRRDTEGPQHRVTIARPFAMGRYAVTFDEFDRFCAVAGRNPTNDRGWGRAQRPVIDVSCEDAEAYCAWLSEETGASYRLPSEAEWEYAARAGTTTPFWWGRTITPDQANYDGNHVYAGGGNKGVYRKETVAVDTFDPNPWGLYQVHGNVWEWCADAWNASYQGAPSDGAVWRSGDAQRAVVRGGSWSYHPRILRSAYRFWDRRSIRVNDVGFRLSRTLGAR